MDNQEAIETLKTLCYTCKLFPKCVYEKPECFKAINMAISALQAQDSETIKICDTCKHDPPSKKWPCVDCDMREPADRWESARTFVELVVKYPAPELCTYKEYKGKPYYSIKYIENGETYVGYGTYKPEVLSQFLKEYFIPFAQPEIVRCKDCEHWKNGHLCEKLSRFGSFETKADFYCGYPERRTDD